MRLTTTPDFHDASVPKEIESAYREYAQLIYKTAYGVTGRREDAEDILQAIFLRLLRRQVHTDFGKNPKAYLYKAAVNMSLDTLRSRRRHPTTENTVCLEIVDSSAVLPDTTLHQRLYEAIAALKPAVAEMLILRYVHDYSDAEIARMLGVSRGSIAVKLFRSRARLKKLLRQSVGDKL